MEIDHPVRIQGKKQYKQRIAPNMSTAEIDEITSKAVTKNTKDYIFSYKKIEQKIEKTENLIS